MVFRSKRTLRKGQGLGTTKKGIGPTYSSKATRNGIRIADLLGNFDDFSKKCRSLCNLYQRMFPILNVNVEEELERYKKHAEKVRHLVSDTVTFLNRTVKSNRRY
ncbi:hypothetical protein WA026_009437 [Henosepilachna vigintioctopunctata]|uniref:Uncharacterized protein n=1 Tax=Henosepilachna vigintioctopunctata TaxID=420089 RepID=A0AAW1U3S7_9CUCU